MAMGRGRCMGVALLAFLLIFEKPSMAVATTHVVGDSQGWGFSMSYADWASGRTFTGGDTLVFNYQPGLHNVVPVNLAGYRSCSARGGASKVGTTGSDTFTLRRGPNYFICSIPGHCSAGMKVLVNAQ